MNKIKKYLSNYSKWKPSSIVILILLSIPFFYFAFFTFEVDNDFWFLINTGKNILKEGFVRIEPFTMHHDFSYMSQQWLSSVIFYWIYNNASELGMFFLILVSNIIIVFLLYKLLILITFNKVKISLIITIITDIFLLFSFLVTRPQLFDIIIFVAELYILELFIHKKKKKYLCILPVLSILLINLHAAMWIMFFVFFIPYILEWLYNYLKKRDNYLIKPILLSLLISLLVGFINPYGVDSIFYLFNSYGLDYINDFILEMNPITISNNVIVYLYVFIILLTYYKNKGKNSLRYFLLFLGTLYLGLSHFKGVVFLIITASLSVGNNIKNIFNETTKSADVPRKNLIIYAEILIFIILIISFNVELLKEKDLKIYNVINFLDTEINKRNYNKSELDIYVGYNDGGYLEYRGYRSYIDPRAEIFVKKNNKQNDIMLEYYNLQNGIINYRDFLEKYQFDYLVLDDDDIIYIYLDKHDKYEKIYETKDDDKDNNYFIYRRFVNENC